ncbi:hypothetical protein AAES_99794 [Amazona aestiva]|uniref:Uncharacterized protein n=1 Tax=Amazona aestiva TaxID=12930 RepID=A0A0Q3PGL1_AMAAE|nr:hypothetical protein AAES_99794 [Amazona aestiva]
MYGTVAARGDETAAQYGPAELEQRPCWGLMEAKLSSGSNLSTQPCPDYTDNNFLSNGEKIDNAKKYKVSM